jgi:hypothetical protein
MLTFAHSDSYQVGGSLQPAEHIECKKSRIGPYPFNYWFRWSQIRTRRIREELWFVLVLDRSSQA